MAAAIVAGMPGPLRVCISGALGDVGRALIAGVVDAPDLVLASAVARRRIGEDVGDVVLGRTLGVPIVADVDAGLAGGADVLVDYTHPSLIRRHIDLAFARRVPVVIGTTGLDDEAFAEIDAGARAAGVGAATGNFSLTAALMQHLARIAAAHVPHWEVVEYGKAEKPDVPSGTARELAEVLGTVRTPVVALGDEDLIGPVAARGATFGGARVHSLRLPGCGVAVEAIFGLPGERLIIRHDEQGDPRIFVAGTLLAARAIQGRPGLVRGLDTLLFASA